MATGDDTTPHPRWTPRRAFGRADERPYRRLVGDVIRLVLATVIVVATARHVGAESAVERAIQRAFDAVPADLHGVFRGLAAIGTLWGVAVLGAAALVARRLRLAAALVGAGALSWFVARTVGFLAQGRSLGNALTAALDGTRAAPYPVVRLAVLAGVVLAAAPFLTRPVRRTGAALLFLVAVGALYRDVGSLDDVAGALAIGWGLAAAVHLALGSPAGRPTTRQVQYALEDLGVAVERVELTADQETGFTRMTATDDAGRLLHLRIYGRDAADTRLVSKAWRFLAYKDTGPTLTFTRLQQVEHEALCTLVAGGAGATVPDVVVLGEAGPSAAVLATRRPDLSPLAADDPRLDTHLASAWRDLACLRRARVAHGALDLEHLGTHGDDVVLHDFSAASVSSSPQRLDRDIAQLLVATAAVAGVPRATQAAVDGLGTETTAAALPFLQKPALSRANRRLLRADKELLDTLRESVTTHTGVEPASPIELRRVKPINIVMFAAFALAIWVIIGQIGSIGDLIDTLKTAQLPWALTGFVLAQCSAVAFALVTIGTVPEQIPLLPAIVLQMGISFANMVAATSVSSTVMNIRFLQKQGVEVGAATSSGVLAGISGTIATFTLFVVSGFIVGEDLRLGEIGGPDRSKGRLILIVVVIGAILFGITLSIPRIRRALRDKAWPQVKGAVRNIWGVVTSPRQFACVAGGALLAPLLYAGCLLCCLLAYGESLPYIEIVFVNTSASFLASLTPVPGGMGVMEASLIAGLSAFGITPEVAAAAVVTHRLFTTYLPPIWGSYAASRLVEEGYL